VRNQKRRKSRPNWHRKFVHRARLQRSEQKRTFSQSFAHFLRHANGFSHAAHIFDGRSAFLTILGIAKFHI
jgi:hypothetical protein